MRNQNRHRYGPGDGCQNVSRPCQPHPNPAPGSTPQAAAAAKNDAKKRDDSLGGMLKAAYKKMTSTAPAAPSANKSGAALADRRDQEAKLKKEY